MPSHSKLLGQIANVANEQVPFPSAMQPTFCSLMLDSAMKFNHQLLAIMSFLQGHTHFLDLVNLRNQKSKTIADAVAPVIRQLADNNLIVTAVCTGNASNEKAILNPKKDYSLQSKTRLPFLRVPCVAHTANLAMQDFLNGEPPSVLSELRKVMNALPDGPTSEFHSMPRITDSCDVPVRS
jgi:hypothetical protein